MWLNLQFLIYLNIQRYACNKLPKNPQNKQTNKKISNLSDSTILYNTLFMIFYLNYIFGLPKRLTQATSDFETYNKYTATL